MYTDVHPCTGERHWSMHTHTGMSPLRRSMQSCDGTRTFIAPRVTGTHWGDALPPRRGARGSSSSATSLGRRWGTGAGKQESELELQPEINLVFLLFALETG